LGKDKGGKKEEKEEESECAMLPHVKESYVVTVEVRFIRNRMPSKDTDFSEKDSSGRRGSVTALDLSATLAQKKVGFSTRPFD
jgi:hypothetical protein